jgi:transcriptional regulator with XRE-family HTH domain
MVFALTGKGTGGIYNAIWHSVGQGEKKTLTSHQIRAARALIRWTAEDLSRQSAVSLRTIRRAELAERDTSMTAANDLAIRRALEAAGVEFIDEDGGGPGVRLRKRLAKKA